MGTLKKLYIEPTSKCNLNCRMCFRNSWVGEQFADMDLSTFDAVIRTMPQTVETIFFGGVGEPLVHKNIVHLVQRASNAGKRVELVTNASLLSTEMSRSLLDAGLDMLWVSIDSFEQLEYEDIRKKGSLGLLQQNLKNFKRQKRESGSQATLGVNFVAMKSNVHQLAFLPGFILQNDIHEVNVSNVLPSSKETASELLYDKLVDWGVGTPNRNAPKINLPLMDWRDDNVLSGMRELLCSMSGEVVLSGQSLARKVNYCKFIEQGNAFVRHDGNISPCMALLHSATTYWLGRQRTVHHHSFGNVKTEGLVFAWESEGYTLFRDRVRRFDFSPCIRCSGCDDWEENTTDCFGNQKPTCGACLWAEGVISCP